MHMYYRIRKNLVSEQQAISELQRFSAANARIHTKPGGFVLLVPTGRRPAAVLQFLNRCAPDEEWDICGWDDDDGNVEVPER